MSNESLQRSVLPNNPVDPSIVRVLRTLDPIAREVDCVYFVAGATARDLILVNIHGLRPGRATRDIDFGIAVENWNRFALLKERLVANGRLHIRSARATTSDLLRSSCRVLHSGRPHPFPRRHSSRRYYQMAAQPRYCHERSRLRRGFGFIHPHPDGGETDHARGVYSRADAPQTCCMVR